MSCGWPLVAVPILSAESDARKGAITFRELFEDREAKDGERAARTLKDYRMSLEADVFPVLGNLPATEITPNRSPACLRLSRLDPSMLPTKPVPRLEAPIVGH